MRAMYGGTGTFTQTGGSSHLRQHGSGPQAIAIFVGGTNNIQGGRNSVTQDSGNGLYNMQGGLLVGGGETVGNYATVSPPPTNRPPCVLEHPLPES